MQINSKNKLRDFINSNMKQTIQEGTFSSFKEFIKRKKTEYDKDSAMSKIIDRALKMNTDQEAESFIDNIIKTTSMSKPFDRINSIPGIENMIASTANTQAKTLIDKWNSGKAFFKF